MLKQTFLLSTCTSAILFAAGCNAEPSMDYVSLPKPVNEPTVTVTGKLSPQQLISEALGQIGTPAVPALSQALTDPDPLVRVEACRALGYMGAKANEAVPALTLALNDPQEAVQLEAARALGDIGDAAGPAVPRLMEMLRTKR
jgi:HEAT repeat protein